MGKKLLGGNFESSNMIGYFKLASTEKKKTLVAKKVTILRKDLIWLPRVTTSYYKVTTVVTFVKEKS